MKPLTVRTIVMCYERNRSPRSDPNAVENLEWTSSCSVTTPSLTWSIRRSKQHVIRYLCDEFINVLFESSDISLWIGFYFIFVGTCINKWLILFQKSAAVHVARHCPSTRTERIFMDWLWWILQGLPFTHLVKFWNVFAEAQH